MALPARTALLLSWLLAACATGGSPPPPAPEPAPLEPPPQTRDWDAGAAQALHAALVPHAADIRACVDAATAQHRVPVDVEPTAWVSYDEDDGAYVEGHRQREAVPFVRPHPFTRALEACLVGKLPGWGLPSPGAARGLSFAVWLYPAAQASLLAPYAPCFEDPSAAPLRTVLEQDAGSTLELWVMQTTKSQKLGGREPAYTREALEERVQGWGVYRCFTLRTGRLERCEVLHSIRHMDVAVLDALATWRMEPGSCNGRAFERRYTFNILLRLPR